MKKFLLPIALFAAFGLAACGDDIEDGGCEVADKVEDSACDISKAEYCSDDDVFKYNGNSYSADDAGMNKLIDALQKDGFCQATVSPEERAKIRTALTSQAKRILDRIRVNAIRAI